MKLKLYSFWLVLTLALFSLTRVNATDCKENTVERGDADGFYKAITSLKGQALSKEEDAELQSLLKSMDVNAQKAINFKALQSTVTGASPKKVLIFLREFDCFWRYPKTEISPFFDFIFNAYPINIEAEKQEDIMNFCTPFLGSGSDYSHLLTALNKFPKEKNLGAFLKEAHTYWWKIDQFRARAILVSMFHHKPGNTLKAFMESLALPKLSLKKDSQTRDIMRAFSGVYAEMQNESQRLAVLHLAKFFAPFIQKKCHQSREEFHPLAALLTFDNSGAEIAFLLTNNYRNFQVNEKVFTRITSLITSFKYHLDYFTNSPNSLAWHIGYFLDESQKEKTYTTFNRVKKYATKQIEQTDEKSDS